MPTLEYQPREPGRRHIGRKVIAATVVFAFVVAGGWLLVRRQSTPTPKYYPRARFLALGNFSGWSVLQEPTIPGPYRYIGGAQSNIGEGVSGSFGSPATRVHFDVAGKPATSLLVAGVENQIGQLSYFVLYRAEPAATGPTPER